MPSTQEHRRRNQPLPKLPIPVEYKLFEDTPIDDDFLQMILTPSTSIMDSNIGESSTSNEKQIAKPKAMESLQYLAPAAEPEVPKFNDSSLSFLGDDFDFIKSFINGSSLDNAIDLLKDEKSTNKENVEPVTVIPDRKGSNIDLINKEILVNSNIPARNISSYVIREPKEQKLYSEKQALANSSSMPLKVAVTTDGMSSKISLKSKKEPTIESPISPISPNSATKPKSKSRLFKRVINIIAGKPVNQETSFSPKSTQGSDIVSPVERYPEPDYIIPKKAVSSADPRQLKNKLNEWIELHPEHKVDEIVLYNEINKGHEEKESYVNKGSIGLHTFKEEESKLMRKPSYIPGAKEQINVVPIDKYRTEISNDSFNDFPKALPINDMNKTELTKKRNALVVAQSIPEDLESFTSSISSTNYSSSTIALADQKSTEFNKSIGLTDYGNNQFVNSMNSNRSLSSHITLEDSNISKPKDFDNSSYMTESVNKLIVSDSSTYAKDSIMGVKSINEELSTPNSPSVLEEMPIDGFGSRTSPKRSTIHDEYPNLEAELKPAPKEIFKKSLNEELEVAREMDKLHSDSDSDSDSDVPLAVQKQRVLTSPNDSSTKLPKQSPEVSSDKDVKGRAARNQHKQGIPSIGSTESFNSKFDISQQIPPIYGVPQHSLNMMNPTQSPYVMNGYHMLQPNGFGHYNIPDNISMVSGSNNQQGIPYNVHAMALYHQHLQLEQQRVNNMLASVESSASSTYSKPNLPYVNHPQYSQYPQYPQTSLPSTLYPNTQKIPAYAQQAIMMNPALAQQLAKMNKKSSSSPPTPSSASSSADINILLPVSSKK